MEYVRLGSTGLKVSRLCLGMMTYGSKRWRDWILDEEESRPFIRRALECGISFFDTADMYSLGASEEVLGRALRDFGPSRDKIVIATKVFYPMGDDLNQHGLSRKHILHAIDDSLRRLGTDYVDLYQIHRFDYETPIEESLSALHDVINAGKARYIGASSMFAWQFAKMLYTADRLGLTRFVTMQNHYNLIYREEEREMIPLCREEGIGIDSLESAGARVPGREPPEGGFWRDDSSEDGRLRSKNVLPGFRFCRGRSSRGDCTQAWRIQHADCTGMDSAATRRHGADHRREQTSASR